MLIFYGENILLMFCGHDEFVLTQKLAPVLQTTLIELNYGVQNALVMTGESTKHVQSCEAKQIQFALQFYHII